MTDCGHKILVVAHTPRLASSLVAWLGESGCDLVLANSYAGGKAQLASHPDLLVTEIKLGEYNGLQLALRGQAAGIPTIVLGPGSEGFAHEAELLGATYLSDDIDSDELNDAIERVLRLASLQGFAAPDWETLTGVGPVVH